jgi:hypothetical protein
VTNTWQPLTPFRCVEVATTAAVVGKALSTSTGSWSGTSPIRYTYQWQRCTSSCSAITGATGSSFTLADGDLGANIAVLVTAANGNGSATAESAEVGPVAVSGPSSAGVKVALSAAISCPPGRRPIAKLLQAGGIKCSFTAPSDGLLVLSWYSLPNGARLSSIERDPKPLLVATASVRFVTAGTKNFEVKLTSAGKKLLEHAKRSLRLTAVASFTPTGGRALSRLSAITLEG